MGDWKIIVPAERTNLFIDPSFRTDPSTEWTISGDGTNDWIWYRASQRWLFGYGSAQSSITTGTYTRLSQTITVPDQGYGVLTCYAKDQAGGGAVSSDDFKAYWGSSIGNVNWESITKMNDDGWYYCRVTGVTGALPPLGEGGIMSSAVAYGVVAFKSGILVDGLQFEAQEQSEGTITESTFMEADQPGCFATGVPFVSKASRLGTTRSGGIVYDLKDDFGFGITSVLGLGALSPDYTLDEYSLLPGGEMNSLKTPARKVTVIGTLTSDASNNIHARRKSLIEILKYDMAPRGTDGWQPVRFRYTGAEVWKDFEAHVVAGLEGKWSLETTNLKTAEQLTLTLIMPDPYCYAIGEPGLALDFRDAPTTYSAFGYRDLDGIWHWPLSSGGTYNEVMDILVASDGQVYIAADWVNINGNAAWDYFIAYDPETGTFWQPGATQGGGAMITGGVVTIAEDSQGYIWIGGNMTTIGTDTNVKYIARYNPKDDTWSNMNGGLNYPVDEIIAAPQGGVYVCGNFTDVYGASSNTYLHIYHTTTSGTKTPLDDGVTANGADDRVYSMAIGADGLLYLGGDFDKCGNSQVDCNCVARYDWDEDAFDDLDGGLAHISTPYCLRVRATWDGNVFFRVFADTADGVDCNSDLMMWNGNFWENVGIDGTWFAMSDLVLGPDGILYFAGAAAGPQPIDNQTGSLIRIGNVWRNFDCFFTNGTYDAGGMAFAIGQIDPGNNKRYVLWFGGNAGLAGGSYVSYVPGYKQYEYRGNAPNFPRIELIASADGDYLMSMRNGLTGARIDFDFFLANSERLTINFDPKEFAIVSNMRGSVPYAALPASDILNFYLAKGTNTILGFVYETNCVAYMFHRTAYDGVD